MQSVDSSHGLLRSRGTLQKHHSQKSRFKPQVGIVKIYADDIGYNPPLGEPLGTPLGANIFSHLFLEVDKEEQV